MPAHISCRKRKTDGAIEKIIITNKDGIFIKPLVLPEHCYDHNQAGGRKGGCAGHWAIHVELVGDGLRELIGRIPFEVCGNMSSERKRTKNEPTEKIGANVSFGPHSSHGTSTISPTAGASADHHDSLPLNMQVGLRAIDGMVQIDHSFRENTKKMLIDRFKLEMQILNLERNME